MTTIKFKDLDDNEILDIVDATVPYIFIPGFRPYLAREWRITDLIFDSNERLENINVRDLTVDIMTDKRTIEKIFKRGQFNQLALFQFERKVPSTLKLDELPTETVDDILIKNGLINRIWINFEFVELSSVDNKYLGTIKDRYKDKLI